MTTAPRGYTRKEVQTVRQRVATGQKSATAVLDGSTSDLTVEVIRFGGAMEKVSFQASGTLTGTIEFSISGENWTSSTAIPGANAIASFNTHNIEGVRVTWTGGVGQLFVAAT
jgi:hypothetical protein